LEVKTPVFIVGTGRCGTTIFHRALSYHPQVTWLSPWCLKYPRRPELNRLAMRLIDLPLVSRYVRKVIYTGEYYPFWERYCRGFSEPCRDLVSDDVTIPVKRAVRKVMGELLSPQRARLLIKITGWPRIGFLKEIFPDAKFIHIYRDGRSVANSWLQMWWWSGWGGPDKWRWGELTPEQRQRWERAGRSFNVLAALGWEILMTAFEAAKCKLPADDLLEIRYEDLCRNPIDLFHAATNFAELEWTPQFEAAVKRFKLESANDKWLHDLTFSQQRLLNDSIGETLQKYGYA